MYIYIFLCVHIYVHTLLTMHMFYSKYLNACKNVKVKVILRPTVIRPVCLVARHPSGTSDQVFPSFFSIDNCEFLYVGRLLTRGWICNLLLQLRLGLAGAVILWSGSHRTHDHILLSHLRLPEPGGPGPRIYIRQKEGGPVIPPGTEFLSCRPLRFVELRWRYSNPPPRGGCRNDVKVILRPTVSRPVRPGVRLPSRSRDKFFPFLVSVAKKDWPTDCWS
jgi:hypothetical protein